MQGCFFVVQGCFFVAERSDQKIGAKLIERTRASPETRGPAFDAQDDVVYELSVCFPRFVRGRPRGTANCHVTLEQNGFFFSLPQKASRSYLLYGVQTARAARNDPGNFWVHPFPTTRMPRKSPLLPTRKGGRRARSPFFENLFTQTTTKPQRNKPVWAPTNINIFLSFEKYGSI